MSAQEANEWSAIYFTIAILGLMAVPITSRWAAFWLQRYSLKNDIHELRRVLFMIRRFRGLLLRKIYPFASLSHVIIFVVYLVINIALCFQNLNRSSLFAFAARLGWIATCNIALVAFLALKNTPLAFLVAWSHEHLKPLHQVAGYCTIFFSLLHAITFTVALSHSSSLTTLLEDQNIMGIVAGICMILILGGALILRKRMYEAFYISHLFLFALVLISVGMHRPDITQKSLIIIIFAASIWTCDYSFRLARTTRYGFGNHASITPLVRGGIRIALHHSFPNAVPGRHVFLWLPKIRALETHPLTIVSTDPLELVVSARSGFTQALFAYASKKPDGKLRASLDGPYGVLPDFEAFDHVLLISGGSGASFAFSVATNLAKKRGNSTSGARPFVNFIWVVRETEYLTWYTRELELLTTSPLIQLTIHVSRLEATTCTKAPLSTTMYGINGYDTTTPVLVPTDNRTPASDSDLEKPSVGHIQVNRSISNVTSKALEVHAGRPDIGALVLNLTNGIETHKKIMIAACGPESMMVATRVAVANILRDSKGQRNVTLHCEQFGW